MEWLVPLKFYLSLEDVSSSLDSLSVDVSSDPDLARVDAVQPGARGAQFEQVVRICKSQIHFSKYRM